MVCSKSISNCVKRTTKNVRKNWKNWKEFLEIENYNILEFRKCYIEWICEEFMNVFSSMLHTSKRRIDKQEDRTEDYTECTAGSQIENWLLWGYSKLVWYVSYWSLRMRDWREWEGENIQRLSGWEFPILLKNNRA